MANTTGLGDTIYAAVKKAINDAEGSGGSGGGGGDFTTAELTYENGSAVPITCAALSNNPEEPAILPMIYGQSGVATVPLYKGHAYFMSGTGGTVTVSGSITAIYEGIYDISGDCSISISNVS